MNPDHSAPPPAYSEQEFDQKVSQATALSVLTPTPSFDAEGWQRYDPNVFNGSPVSPSGPITPVEVRNGSYNTTTSSYANGGVIPHNQWTLPSTQYHDKSSSRPINNLPAIVPLRVEKKSQIQYGKSLTYQGYPERKGSPAPYPNRISSIGSSGAFLNAYNGGDNQHSQDSPSRPVPAPSPPSSFGGIASFAAQPPVQAPIYQRDGDEEVYDPYRDYQESQPQVYSSSRQSLPAIPQGTSQRPTHTHTRSRSETHNPPSVPRLQFDPAVAYGQSNSTPVTAIQAIHANIPMSPVSSMQYDPHSLYHSTVSSKLVPMRPSQGDVYHQVHSYEPNYNQGQNMAYSPRTGQQTRQTPWQSPSRPTSTYPTTTTPQPNSTPDPNRFSQYSSNPTRDSVYNNDNNWHSHR